MQRNYLFLMLILTLAIANVGCKKETETVYQTNPLLSGNELKEVDYSFYENIDQLKTACEKVFDKQFFSGWYGDFEFADRLLFDIMSDNLWNFPGGIANYPISETYLRMSNGQVSEVNSSAVNSLGLLSSVEIIVNYFDNRRSDASNVLHSYGETLPDDLNRLNASLYIVRANALFHVALRHCPPPGSSEFATKTVFPYSKTKTAKLTGQQIFDSAIVNINKAEQLMSEKTKIIYPYKNYEYVNPYMITALKSKIFFQLGASDIRYYDSALKCVDYVLANGGYNLENEPLTPFINESSSENIWSALSQYDYLYYTPKAFTLFGWNKYSATYSNTDDPYNLSYLVNYKNRCTWHSFSMSEATTKYIQWFDADNDSTDEAKKDKRYTQLYLRIEPNDETIDVRDLPEYYETSFRSITRPNIWCHKYYREQDGMYSGVPVIRLAELYLTKAITEYKLNVGDKGLNAVNMVRTRAGLDALTTITEEDIHRERCREMAFEGDRLNYLKALKINIPAGDRDDHTAVPFDSPLLYWSNFSF